VYVRSVKSYRIVGRPLKSTRTSVEGEKDERVVNKIFVESFVDETIGIKFEGYSY
jgi:hypothetical protein